MLIRGSLDELRVGAQTARPDRVLLIGAQKAGTSYLHNMLMATGQFRQAQVKEPHYFTSDRQRTQSHADLFAGRRTDGILLDSSTSYLHNPGCAALIHDVCPERTVIVAILRDPRDRAMSAYLHMVKHGCETRRFDEVLALTSCSHDEIRAEEIDRARRALARGQIALRRPGSQPFHMYDRRLLEPFWNFAYISNSMYAPQLAPFLSRFGTVLILRFEDLAAGGRDAVQHVLDAVGCGAASAPSLEAARNPTRLSRRQAFREYLRNLRADPGSPPSWSRAALRGSARLLAGRLRPRAADWDQIHPWAEAFEQAQKGPWS